MTSFESLKENNSLFEKLSSDPPQWWKSLVQDDEINIEVRKENYIDVYYHGGAIIKELSYSNRFSGKIHFEYIPLESENVYVPYDFTDGVVIDKTKLNFISLESFSKEALKKLKKRISQFYDNSSEKAIQAGFIKNDPSYIDSEFQYSYKNITGEQIRIDLTRIDPEHKKIVFIEVKRMGDPRLYNNEIRQQLQSYKNFINDNEKQLLSYYKRLFMIKKKLSILPKGLLDIESLDGYSIAEKPLLLFGDCEQEWINEHSEHLNGKIRDIAFGCYYFGKPKYSAAIIKKTNNNRHIFLESR